MGKWDHHVRAVGQAIREIQAHGPMPLAKDLEDVLFSLKYRLEESIKALDGEEMPDTMRFGGVPYRRDHVAELSDELGKLEDRLDSMDPNY